MLRIDLSPTEKDGFEVARGKEEKGKGRKGNLGEGLPGLAERNRNA